MAGFTLSVFSLIWAILIICLCISGIWVFFSIRRSFAPVLVFDLVYLIMLEMLCLAALTDPVNAAETPLYLITFVTFLLNIALTLVIFLEWRDAPHRMNEYIWWLKIALAITGIFTIIPLGLYYLRLYYLPRHPARKKERTADFLVAASGSFPDPAFTGPGIPPPEMVVLDSAVPPSTLIGRYRDWTYLGHGGFARVFRVTKKEGGAVVALKVPIVPDLKTGETFMAELVNWTKLGHENIVRVVEFNILPVPFFEMEFCESSLAETKKPVDPFAAAAMVYDICGGLKYCHGKGVVHLDLKPSNILVCQNICKISDWGLSRVLTESNITVSQLWFTPQYAAPEQVLGQPKDARTDLWQAGVILYELLTGTVPYGGGNITEILAGIITRDPPPPSSLVPGTGWLDPVVARCLRRDPAARYQSAGEMQAAVAGCLREEYTRLLTRSIADSDPKGSEWYCCNLFLLALREGDLAVAFRISSELLNYTPWLRRGTVQALMNRIQEDLREGAGPSPDLVRLAGDHLRTLQEEREVP